jgi:hypothetical protein
MITIEVSGGERGMAELSVPKKGENFVGFTKIALCKPQRPNKEV